MNSLLQEALIQTKHISQAAIIRQKDGSIKAKSANFQFSQEELDKITNAFVSPRDLRTGDNGIVFMENFYKPVRADKFSIYAKNEKSGLIISKTNLHYIVGAYDASMYASVAAEAVEKLAEYLRSKDK
ncbi:profilin-4-like protein [Gorgonomyces haynaldii]|nr:profilin-4-like protein [Gorgonomyces haynaldii]